ncbi:hypothetical protein GS634_10115 [Ruegeria atlantica]|uniref:Di-haem cytochrome c peroxidase domain-containing protein n=1 Tax=Ruegeria atlantica TaxID=81569 RepID=A0AA90YWI6_9RHOB|nr:cytochrome-c peroxidase [Ruegeria atlantica]NOE18468.1 hypothetical protein [Ruegeria atlantica]
MTLTYCAKRSAKLIISIFYLTMVIACTAARADVQPLPPPLTDTDFLWDGNPDEALVTLGQNLFFDPILSGNHNISCGTCHDPSLGTEDGLALGIGEGGQGAGLKRETKDGVIGRVPRNAQPLYNIGARSYTRMFHDGRLEPDDQKTFPSGFWSPAREHLPAGLPNTPSLTAQSRPPAGVPNAATAVPHSRHSLRHHDHAVGRRPMCGQRVLSPRAPTTDSALLLVQKMDCKQAGATP